MHLRQDALGALDGLRRARKEIVGMLDNVSDFGDLIRSLYDLNDGRCRGAGACHFEGCCLKFSVANCFGEEFVEAHDVSFKRVCRWVRERST